MTLSKADSPESCVLLSRLPTGPQRWVNLGVNAKGNNEKGRAITDSASLHRILTDAANIRNFRLWLPGAVSVVKITACH
jgi:hypothetical protein